MKKLLGVIDFDKIHCLIMIDDGEEYRFTEPKWFRIEVIGCGKEFVFETPTSEMLRNWTNAMYANWNES